MLLCANVRVRKPSQAAKDHQRETTRMLLCANVRVRKPSQAAKDHQRETTRNQQTIKLYSSKWRRVDDLQ